MCKDARTGVAGYGQNGSDVERRQTAYDTWDYRTAFWPVAVRTDYRRGALGAL